MQRAVLPFILLGILPIQLCAEVSSWLFRIHDGTYVVIGGISGSWSTPLPSSEQEYIDLELDHTAGNAEMRILDQWAEREFLRFTNGRIEGASITFTNTVMHPYHPAVRTNMTLAYSVQIGDASLWMDGSISGRVGCCDIPGTFQHNGVHATIVSGPPPNPVGIYEYEGHDQVGMLVVTGLLAITSRENPLPGWWRLDRSMNAGEVGPQTGTGSLSGMLDGAGLYIDLNPGVADDNVFLSGTLTDGVYRGGWAYSTLLGTVAFGSFEAKRLSVSMHPPRFRPDGIVVFEHRLPAGLKCVLECTETLSPANWLELSRFIASEEPVEIRLGVQLATRFYRLRILD